MTDLPAFAIVGMGGFARTHLSYVRKTEEAGLGRHVAQVAIPADQERYPEEISDLKSHGVEIYASLREMLAAARDRIDVTCIPTGIPLHRPMATAALEAGTHVLVEKPAAGCIQDVDAMLRARDHSGKHCAVGYQHLYRPDTQRIKAWVCEGRLGKIRRIRTFGCWPRGRTYYTRNGWAGRLSVEDTWVLDSPHNNALAHAVNAMNYLACSRPGESAVPLSIQAELYRANPIASADTAVFRATTDEGAEIFFAVSHCTDQTLHPVTIIEGERGRVEWSYYGETKVRWSDGSEQTFEKPEASPRVAEDVAEVLLGRKASLYGPLDVARAQTLCICGTFESSAIHDLPSNLRIEDPETDITAVRGMTEAVLRAHENAALFSELGLPWARAGDRISLEGYRYFPTFRRDMV
ncbi:MAG: Gfo/Idh/MocA family oxidoreductase [Candidatus Latescibacteria bacterium]|nr:Gfo/Idh/MocA family oxidoreductase [Candidatus Latescibacterota bacterium]